MTYYFSDATLIAKLGELIGRTLDSADCVVDESSAINVDPSSSRDVSVNIVIPTPDSSATELRQVRYNLFDLTNIGSYPVQKHTASETQTTHQLLGAITRAVGFPITANDIIDTPCIVPDIGANEFIIPLIAKDGSKWFKGTYNLMALRTNDLDVLISNIDADGFVAVT